MADRKQNVFFDTSFFIRLYKPDDPDHKNARAYWQRLLKEGHELFLSTIVAAEFGTGGAIDKLPYRTLPFCLLTSTMQSDLQHLLGLLMTVKGRA
ncbi:MAG: PIN domain-containing protein [Bacteroidetes bacterium]|nr:PIN domain-containing protein [Bacteroidota bacterium]